MIWPGTSPTCAAVIKLWTRPPPAWTFLLFRCSCRNLNDPFISHLEDIFETYNPTYK